MKINKKTIITISVTALLLILLAVILSFYCISGKLESITEGKAEPMALGYIREEAEVPLPEGALPIEKIGFKNSNFIRIAAGGSYYLEYTTEPENATESVTWRSTNEKCVLIDQKGNLEALSFGESMIIATPSSGKARAGALVMVLSPPPSILDVPYIWQVADYPNGCESCSAVMALNYVGIDIGTDEFIDKYLDMCEVPHVDESGVYSGYSPWTHFAGDPRDESGLCCYAPVIANAMKKFVDTDKYSIDEMYDVPIETLCSKYILNGIPVIFWATMYMEEPYLMDWTWTVTDGKPGETFTWVAPMHCMLLVGFDDDYYYFNDPIAGKKVAYTKEATEKAYEGLFRQAVAVYPTEND